MKPNHWAKCPKCGMTLCTQIYQTVFFATGNINSQYKCEKNHKFIIKYKGSK